MPGIGGIRQQAALLAQLMDLEFDQPAHVFGNSMGGAAAVALAALRPDKVASLTLISPALPHPRPSTAAVMFTALATPRLGKVVLDRSKRIPFERRLEAGLSVVFGDPRALPPEIRTISELPGDSASSERVVRTP